MMSTDAIVEEVLKYFTLEKAAIPYYKNIPLQDTLILSSQSSTKISIKKLTFGLIFKEKNII